MIPRFHCPFPLAPGAQVDLPEAAAHHAIRVLRLKEGAPLILFDGRGGEWQATIVGAGGTASRMMRVALQSFDATDRESPLQITLAQGLPSGDKMDWVVEKSVELGVAAIQPVAAKRSVIRLSGERMDRRITHWNNIASAACEQCGRNQVPVVAPVLDLPRYLAQTKGQNTLRLLLSPDTGIALHELAKPSTPLVTLIGPEGGWEEGEMLAAQAAGFQPIRLGPRILRTETAGAAVLAAMQAIWGDF
ncbi:MAG: 16S rRNA (uracil(1498)-N(3))-methyltransferase [Gammaproteobacteria bacterium]|nr:16S rRNA (uracil(1498)-N(3))-methyltransferase [Rhodocyclaceae bacterium]MBU3909714.1 16S rRNA (uracil(1498)-N(3))-methyltransferase [Gammaproteobacteria bacterium]MBU3989274.1 16S rRNA (uracil(1498)-N(3))-methyltransferase [Gammaproteobacteria bacterium]MBU4005247.1 16S rRNA (uracil(1498)-N(3))-methyltransferase [Gammaproteobacteria bacterium]MBU4022426.1 16S rRNA (uracil(1498)-N(3))-methyltransferase [Gammaproteobacteria bacterium]